jgi:NADH dehydrogenase
MSRTSAKVCILGGGFAGLYTALRLSGLPWQQKPEITLVDKSDRFVFLPLLYELVTGELQTWEVAPPYAELLTNTGVKHRQGEVRSIDISNRQVYLQDGASLEYDRLVLALGGETPPSSTPGVQEYTKPFRTVQHAYWLAEKLGELADKDKVRVAVVGAGYVGVEIACKLADRLQERGRIRIIETGTEILRNSPDFNRQAAKKALEDRQIWLDLETKVTAVTADTISLEYKGQLDTIPVDIVLWTVGSRVPGVVRSLPLPQNSRQQIITTPTLQVQGHPELFALGDLAECHDASGQLVPTTAQAAYQQADYAGWNLWASLDEQPRPLLPMRYQHLGEMLALGTDNATLSGLGLTLDGGLAYITRRLAYLYRMPTRQHQIKVGINWITKPLADLLTAR